MKNQECNSNRELWIKIIVGLALLIFFLLGFGYGYIYQGDCMRNPLLYGLLELNKQTQDDYTCVCSSNILPEVGVSKEPLRFDKDGLVEDYLFDIKNIKLNLN